METSYSKPELTYKLLFNENPHPLLLVDLHSFNILKVNKAATIKYGYSHEEFQQLNLANLRYPEDRNILPIPIKDENNGHYIETVIRHTTKEYETILVNILSRRLRYKGMEVMYASINDITDIRDFDVRLASAQAEAKDTERQKIAKEIHDGLVQTLTASSIYFNSLTDSLVNQNQVSKDRLAKGCHILSTAIEHARQLSHDLTPDNISDSNLTELVEDLIDQSRETSQIKFDFSNNLPEMNLSEDLKLHIFRMMQEVIQNIIKHAEAKNVNVALTKTDKKIMLSIQDDGKGFDHRILYNRKKGIGFRNMRYRASAINGILNIFSELNVGTRIVLRAPILYV